MSAFISAQEGNEIVMLTDGAAYTQDGTVVRLGSKVTVGKLAPIAITTRGNHTIGHKHQQRLCDAADRIGVDAALSAFEEVFPQLAARPEHKGLDHMHYHIAAYSESRGLIRVSGHNLPFAFDDGEKPGALKIVTGTYSAGNVVTMADYAAQGVTPRRPGERLSDFLHRVGAGMMEAMRRKPATLLPGEQSDGPQYLIGGQCDFTLVTPDGAATATLRTWPDRVGEKINPFAADEPVKLSRQQRRALEREQRKLVAA